MSKKAEISYKVESGQFHKASPRPLKGVLGPLQSQSGGKLYLLEDSNLLDCDGPFVFGSHIGENVWFHSGETESKHS